MPYLVLGIAVIVGAVLVVRGLRNANPAAVMNLFKWLAIAVGVIVVVALALRGGLWTLAWAAAFLAPIIFRWRALGRMAKSWRGPQPGQSSDVETRYLRMSLDHDTGELEGTVLDGQFSGRRLRELDQEQQFALLQECRVNDEQSAQILESYFDRIYGPDWRMAGAGGGDSGGNSGASAGPGTMSPDEAYSILGLAKGATTEEIKEAHRRLMVKLHPDQGGSTYLAAKINQAKDLLLDD